MQNFVTPAAFYVVRPKNWKPTHPFLIFDGGMQIATSGFHTYNHNLISEVRVLFSRRHIDLRSPREPAEFKALAHFA